ncbi:NHL repeat-containing protein 2 [Hordeum vulgare]|nr:NHL repeat-containing protein 2 [Hordeum vulgare]
MGPSATHLPCPRLFNADDALLDETGRIPTTPVRCFVDMYAIIKQARRPRNPLRRRPLTSGFIGIRYIKVATPPNSTPQHKSFPILLPCTAYSMTAGGEVPWESISMEMKHELVTLTAAWYIRRARRIEACLSSSSTEVSDDKDDTTMDTGSDDTALTPASVHAGFTMEEAHAHYNTAMTEGKLVSMPTPALERALEQHRLALDQINDERVSEEALATIDTENPNFVTEQCALYDALHT